MNKDKQELIKKIELECVQSIAEGRDADFTHIADYVESKKAEWQREAFERSISYVELKLRQMIWDDKDREDFLDFMSKYLTSPKEPQNG